MVVWPLIAHAWYAYIILFDVDLSTHICLLEERSYITHHCCWTVLSFFKERTGGYGPGTMGHLTSDNKKTRKPILTHICHLKIKELVKEFN
jgi:hypothetical protein